MNGTIPRLAAIAASIGLTQGVSAQATFERLGYAYPEYPSSVGEGISSNGRFIVGLVGGAAPQQFRAYLWSRDTGMVLLEAARDPPLDSGLDVSDDGTVVVGGASPMAVAWVNGKAVILPTLPGAPLPDGYAVSVSGDGRTIVGVAYPTRGAAVGVRWRDFKVIENLSLLPGEAVPRTMFAIAEDGEPATIAGAGANMGVRAIRISNDYVQDLGQLIPPSRVRCVEQTAYHVSDDGRRVVGKSCSPTVFYGEGFLWSEPTGMVGLGTIRSAVNLSDARAISGDGRVVGGLTGTNQLYIYRGYIWDPVRGMRHLDAVLDALGVDRQGWSIHEVNAISRDGTAMTGTALDPTVTRGEAFLVTLPPWCWADCTGNDVVDFNDLICFLNRFERAQDPRTNPIDFFYCDLAADDTIDFNDFLAFLNLYNRGCPR